MNGAPHGSVVRSVSGAGAGVPDGVSGAPYAVRCGAPGVQSPWPVPPLPKPPLEIPPHFRFSSGGGSGEVSEPEALSW